MRVAKSKRERGSEGKSNQLNKHHLRPNTKQSGSFLVCVDVHVVVVVVASVDPCFLMRKTNSQWELATDLFCSIARHQQVVVAGHYYYYYYYYYYC